jgi:hypothetical protein
MKSEYPNIWWRIVNNDAYDHWLWNDMVFWWSLLVFRDIADVLNSDNILEKHFYGKEKELIFEKCELLPHQRAWLEGRICRDTFHLIRMLRRSPIERKFSIAYIEHYDIVCWKHESDEREIRSVISSEGYNTKMFWTFAPYLFQVLMQRGMMEREAVQKILFWAKDAKSLGNQGGTYYLNGLEYWNCSRVLNENPDHITHIFTAQEAERIADILMQ